jgi:hypothetical protein
MDDNLSKIEKIGALIDDIYTVLGIDSDGPIDHDFDEESILAYLHGPHITTYILFIIPEAVASITAHNAAMLADLQKIGRVVTITQSTALSVPTFESFTFCVLGTSLGGTAWKTSNLAHVKTIKGLPILCVDSACAGYIGMGSSNFNDSDTIIDGIATIEGSMIGVGIHGLTGFAAGDNTIAANAVAIGSIDMSDSDITETVICNENGETGNTKVTLGIIHRVQPDGSVGIDEHGNEVPATRVFYGPGYSYNSLNTLGQGMLRILSLAMIHSTTIGAMTFSQVGLGSLQTKLFGNMLSLFGATNPLVEFLCGADSLGTRPPAGKSLYDFLLSTDNAYSSSAATDYNTPGTPGAAVFTIDTDTRYELKGISVDISAFTAAATVTLQVQRSMSAAGGSYKNSGAAVSFVVGTDPDLVEFADIAHYGYVRVMAYSNNAGDTAVEVPFTYIKCPME